MLDITVQIEMYNPIKKSSEMKLLNGTFESVEEAKEFYAAEFGTTEEEIKIISVNDVKG